MSEIIGLFSLDDSFNEHMSLTLYPDSFAVRVDGELIEEAPVAELPMAQRYFLF